MRKLLSIALAGFAVVAAAQGCSGRKGEVACGDRTCNAGTYCDQYQYCQTGCTSNSNCADGETCTKAAGAEVGSCISSTGAVPTSTGTPSCIAVPEMDSKCAGTGTKAYRCNPTDKGPAGCPAHPDQRTYPGGYCCP